MRSTLSLILLASSLLSGGAVITVAGTAVGRATTAAGLAVDATVGTAKVIGSAVTPGSSDDK